MSISARYWRLVVEGNAAVWQPSEIRLKLAGVSVSANKPVTASSTLSPSFAPANAVDGNLFSSYCNQNNQFPVVFDIDLLLPNGVDELNISHINAYSAKQIVLQCSFDKVTWYEIERFENLVEGWSEDPAVSRSFSVSRNRFEVVPEKGVSAGSRPVRIRSKIGLDLSATTGVQFGSVAATDVRAEGKDVLCTTPAHATGSVDVTLISGDPETAISAYEYVPVAPITVTQIPALVIELHNPAIRVSQFSALIIDVPVRPILATQILGVAPIIEREVPFPEPFLASSDGDFVENLVWINSVFTAHNGREQRQALVDNPKIRLEVNADFTNPEERRAFVDILNRHADKYVGWPLYQYGANLEPANEGDQTLKFNRDIDDLREGEQAAIYDTHTERTHVVTVDQLTFTGCTLTEPLGFEVTRACQIFPVVRFRITNPGALSTQSVSGTLKLKLESERGRNLVQEFDNLQLKMVGGIPVIEKYQLAGVEDSYDKGVEWSDTGPAIASPYSAYRLARVSGTRTFKTGRYTGEMRYWRNLLEFLRGRQGVFFLPSFMNDLPLHEEPLLGAESIVTSNLQVEKYLSGNVNRTIRIETEIGSIYRKISGSRVLFDGEGNPKSIRLMLDQPLSEEAGSNKVKRISFCPKARLASDVVTLTHLPLETYIGIEYRTVDE